MSYFHEYFLVKNGEKTLRGYSKLINLNRFGKSWVSSPNELFTIGYAIADSKHNRVIPKGNEDFIRRVTKLERTSASIAREDI
jgi:hypothetical protein